METIDLIFGLLLAWFCLWCILAGWSKGTK
jgi:hypothetical protein